MLTETIRAKGHHNVTATHKTTLQITRDEHISQRADCIVAVAADRALSDLTSEVKSALKADAAKVRLSICVDDAIEVITGFGNVALTQSDDHDIVVRKSAFTSARTLMVRADKAAADLDRTFVEKLKKLENVIIIVEVNF